MAKRPQAAVSERPLQRGQRLELTLGDVDAFGECVACVDGFPVHVFGGIPGERVIAEVVRCYRERAEARVVEVLEPSSDRVTPQCPIFWPCTGCQWQHVRCDRQLALKRDLLARALTASGLAGPLPLWPTLPSPRMLGYRNHARFTIGPAGSVGYVNRATRNFVQADRCLIMDEGINRALKALQGKGAETSQMSVRYGVGTGELLVQPRLRSPWVTIPTGQPYYHEEVLGRRFRVASPSFFQVNTVQTERLVRLLRGLLQDGQAGRLVDAYAGVGTFGALLAPVAERVVAIEESVSAVRDIGENIAGLGNVTVLQGKTEHVLAQMSERPDVLVLDPPRAGCEAEALAAVSRLRPERVLYVSCEPETLGRDLKVLLDGPFRLVALVPVDMFPQTHHVECVAVLEATTASTGGLGEAELGAREARPLILASASPRRHELLQLLGLPFTAVPSSVDESQLNGKGDSSEAYVCALALAKAMDVGASCSTGKEVVIGADTTVVLDGRRLGKPGSREEARAMLSALRGRTHEVFTGVAVLDARTGRHAVTAERTAVTMRAYADGELEAYVASGEPFDKAGGYAVQDTTFRPAERVEGCAFNVIGLPACRLPRILEQFGIIAPASGVFGDDGECRVCSLWLPVHQGAPS